MRCHSFAKGSSQSSIASVGVVYGAKWPAGPHTTSQVAPDPAEISAPANADDKPPAGQLACQPKSDRMLHANEYTLHRHSSIVFNQFAFSAFETHQGSQQTMSGH